MKTVHLLCICFVFSVFTCCAHTEDIKANNEKDLAYEQDQKESNTNPKLKIKSGFRSGVSLGIKNHSICGNFIDVENNSAKRQNLDLNKRHLAVNLSIGYDKTFGSFVLGADANIVFNPGSEIEYPNKNNVNIANVKTGTEYLGFAKLGIDLGHFKIYGKLGGGLSHMKYIWKMNNMPNNNSSYLGSFAFGGGIEFKLSEHISVNFDFIKSNKSTVEKLNVKTDKEKTDTATIASYQITMGCGYRF